MTPHEPPASVELAPCPFCQSADVSISFSATTTSPDPAARFVECEDCAAMGPSFKIEDGNDAGAQTKAITAWNTRASTPPARPGREEIARVLFDQRQTQHDFDDAEDADHESDAGTLRSICFDDADAILALFDGASA